MITKIAVLILGIHALFFGLLTLKLTDRITCLEQGRVYVGHGFCAEVDKQ